MIDSAVRELLETKIDALHSLTDAHINSLRERIDERFFTLEKETSRAAQLIKEKSIEENKIREQLREQNQEFVKQTGLLVSRQEFKMLTDRIEELERNKAKLEGKASQTSVLISYLISGIAIVLSILKLLGS